MASTPIIAQATVDTLLIQTALDVMHKRIDSLERDASVALKTAKELAASQALFEYKHETAKKVSDKLEKIVDRICDKGEDELRKTIEMLDRREAKLAENIVAHKEIILREVALQHQSLKTDITTLVRELGDLKQSTAEDRKDFVTLQKWMWGLIGAAAVMSFLGDKIVGALF